MKQFTNNIYLGDTLDMMKQIDDESIDLIITDPPYGMAYHGNRRNEKADAWGNVDKKFDHIENDSGEEFEALLLSYITECLRIMKPDTAMYMFCSWHKVGFFQAELEKHFTLKNLLVWNKNNHTVGDLYGSYAPKHELVWFCHKGRVTMQDTKRHTDVLDHDDETILNDMVIMDHKKIHDPVHPTMKPIDMLRKFVRTSSKENDLIFDGFMGSGSTAVAAAKEGRQFMGAELSPEYHKIASDKANAAIQDKEAEDASKSYLEW